VSAQLADVGLNDTAFPHLTMIRQMDVEDVLTEALGRRGIQIERGVELVDASSAAGLAHGILRSDGRVLESTSRFLVGCDGPSSTLRGVMGTGWHGGPYREEVVLADAELAGPLTPGVLHVAAGRGGLVFVFALGEGATWRILATRPARGGDVPFGQPGPPVPEADVQQILDAGHLGVTLRALRWSAQVRLQHRLASSFRQGPLLLAGDAAHTHSPAAAQGMNTGILDAVNLGWKLAFASDGSEHPELLDSYEQERRPVARQVLALTHVVFFAEASTNPVAAFLRGTLVPRVAPAVPLLLRQRLLLAEVVRLLSQGWVRYRSSPLSLDGARGGAGPHPGDRLPDSDVVSGGHRRRLHDLTASPGVHVLLQRDAEGAADLAGTRHVTVHRIDSWLGTGLLAVRPDGYVGFRTAVASDRQLAVWLDLVAAR
jgi:2-polyprenyl-6-methoxyphenol hydroxylase-like FAD-dependent oxidoreductase